MAASSDEETWNPGSDDILTHFKTLDEQHRSLPSTHPDIAKSLNSIAGVYYRLGKYGASLKYFQDSLEMYREIWPRENHPDIAATLSNIGLVCAAQGNFELALKFNQEALQMHRECLPDNHPIIGRSIMNVTDSYLKLEMFKEAGEVLAQPSARLRAKGKKAAEKKKKYKKKRR